jgi:putative phosphoribosyl transferase
VTAAAAIHSLRKQEPSQIVLAVGVCPPRTASALAELADEVISIAEPDPFFSVGTWYRDFSQTTDAEVLELLSRHRRQQAG